MEAKIMARHLPGKTNIIVDALSRPDKVISTEWTLQPSVLRQIQSTWEHMKLPPQKWLRCGLLEAFISSLQQQPPR